MILVTLIYLFVISLYNLSDLWCSGCQVNCLDCQTYWSVAFYSAIFLPLTVIYYKLSNYQVLKSKRILFKIASIFSGLYLIHQFVLLASKDFDSFYFQIQKQLWIGIFVGFVILSLLYFILWLIRYEYD